MVTWRITALPHADCERLRSLSNVELLIMTLYCYAIVAILQSRVWHTQQYDDLPKYMESAKIKLRSFM